MAAQSRGTRHSARTGSSIRGRLVGGMDRYRRCRPRSVRRGRTDPPPGAPDEHEVAEYYEGFANSTIWPLYHDAVVAPTFRREWWHAYQQVNRRFAEAASLAAAPGATVWVHDYQLQLVPHMLRELRPDVRIGFFLHIPFPPPELFLQLPWRKATIESLLGADLIGFHLPGAPRISGT